jgi:hypothetical protein
MRVFKLRGKKHFQLVLCCQSKIGLYRYSHNGSYQTKAMQKRRPPFPRTKNTKMTYNSSASSAQNYHLEKSSDTTVELISPIIYTSEENTQQSKTLEYSPIFIMCCCKHLTKEMRKAKSISLETKEVLKDLRRERKRNRRTLFLF